MDHLSLNIVISPRGYNVFRGVDDPKILDLIVYAIPLRRCCEIDRHSAQEGAREKVW